jgi:hypothetical protein
MCNAWNHYPGCTCDFGPPYAVSGKIILAKRDEWINYAVSSETAFQKGLEEAGFDLPAIAKGRKLYQDAIEKKKDVMSRIMKFIGYYKYVEISSEPPRDIIIPLFKLHLPQKDDESKVDRSKVIFEESTLTGNSNNWEIEVFGAGMGATRTVKIECSTKIIAENGYCKIIYVKIPIRVKKMARREGQRRINYFLQVEIDEEKSRTFRNGTKSCNKNDCKEDIKLIGPHYLEYELAGDLSGSINTYDETWTYDSGHSVKIGVSAFKMNAFIEARIFRQRQLKLTFELPGGHDYLLFPLKNKNGIKWKVFDNHNQTEEYKKKLYKSNN